MAPSTSNTSYQVILHAIHDRQIVRPSDGPKSLLFTGTDSNLIATYLGARDVDADSISSWTFDGPDYSVKGFFNHLYQRFIAICEENTELNDYVKPLQELASAREINASALIELLGEISRKTYLRIVIPHFEHVSPEASQFIKNLLKTRFPSITLILAIDKVPSDLHHVEVLRKMHLRFERDGDFKDKTQIDTERDLGFKPSTLTGSLPIESPLMLTTEEKEPVFGADPAIDANHDALILGVIAQFFPYAVPEKWLNSIFNRGGILYTVNHVPFRVQQHYIKPRMAALKEKGSLIETSDGFIISNPISNAQATTVADTIRVTPAGQPTQSLPVFAAEHFVTDTLLDLIGFTVQKTPRELAVTYPAYTQQLLVKGDLTKDEAAFVSEKIKEWKDVGAYENIHTAINLLLKFYESLLSKNIHDISSKQKIVELWKIKLENVTDANVNDVTQQALDFTKTDVFTACPADLQIVLYTKLFQIYGTQSDVDSGAKLIAHVKALSPEELKPNLNAGRLSLARASSRERCNQLAKRITELHHKYDEVCGNKTNANRSNVIVSYLQGRIADLFSEDPFSQYQDAVFFIMVKDLKLSSYFKAEYLTDLAQHQKKFTKIKEKIEAYLDANKARLYQTFAALIFYREVLPISYIAEGQRMLCFEITNKCVEFFLAQGIYCSTLLSQASMVLMAERGVALREHSSTQSLYNVIREYSQEFPHDTFLQMMRLVSHPRFDAINESFIDEYVAVSQQALQQGNYIVSIFTAIAVLKNMEMAFSHDLKLMTERKRKLITEILEHFINLPAFLQHALNLAVSFRHAQAEGGFPDIPLPSISAINEIFNRQFKGKVIQELLATLPAILTKKQFYNFSQCVLDDNFDSISGYDKIKIILYIMKSTAGVAEALYNEISRCITIGEYDEAFELSALCVKHEITKGLTGRVAEAAFIALIAKATVLTHSTMEEVPENIRQFLISSKIRTAFTHFGHALLGSKPLPLPAQERARDIIETTPEARIYADITELATDQLQHKDNKVAAKILALSTASTSDIKNGLGLAQSLVLAGMLEKNKSVQLMKQAEHERTPGEKEKLTQLAKAALDNAKLLFEKAYIFFNFYNAPYLSGQIQKEYPSIGSAFSQEVQSVVDYISGSKSLSNDLSLSADLSAALLAFTQVYRDFGSREFAVDRQGSTKTTEGFTDPLAKAIAKATDGYTEATFTKYADDDHSEQANIEGKIFLERAFKLTITLILTELQQRYSMFTAIDALKIIVIEKPKIGQKTQRLTNDLLNEGVIEQRPIHAYEIPQIATSINGYQIAIHSNPSQLFSTDPHYTFPSNDNAESTLIVISIGDFSVLIKSPNELIGSVNATEVRNMFTPAIFAVLQILLKDVVGLAVSLSDRQSTHTQDSDSTRGTSSSNILPYTNPSSALLFRFKFASDVMEQTVKDLRHLTTWCKNSDVSQSLFTLPSDEIRRTLQNMRKISERMPPTWVKIKNLFMSEEFQKNLVAALSNDSASSKDEYQSKLLDILEILANQQLLFLTTKNGLPGALVTFLTNQKAELESHLSLLLELHYVFLALKDSSSTQPFDAMIKNGASHTPFGKYSSDVIHSKESIMCYLAIEYCLFAYENKICNEDLLMKYFDSIMTHFIFVQNGEANHRWVPINSRPELVLNIDDTTRRDTIRAMAQLKQNKESSGTVNMTAVFDELHKLQFQMRLLLTSSVYADYRKSDKDAGQSNFRRKRKE